jgi:hypothetical protein
MVFVIIFGGVFAGAYLSNTLPKHHLADDAKDVVRLGTGLVATIAALVLGLLIASANSSYETQSGQVKRLSADIILLDEMLAQYGPDARPGRDLLRRAVDQLVDRIWQQNSARSIEQAPFMATSTSEEAFREFQALEPTSDAQRTLKARVIDLTNDLAQTRLLLFEQADNPIPIPFLAVLVFWLAIIFASFSLFARLNPTVVAALSVFALSASGAIFLILELSQPFTGLMQISSAPLANALAPL